MNEHFLKQLNELMEVNKTRRVNIIQLIDKLEKKINNISYNYLFNTFQPEIHIIISELLPKGFIITKNKSHIKNMHNNIQYKQYRQRNWHDVRFLDLNPNMESSDILTYLNNIPLTTMIQKMNDIMRIAYTNQNKFINKRIHLTKQITKDNLKTLDIGYNTIKIVDIDPNLKHISLIKNGTSLYLTVSNIDNYDNATYNDHIYDLIIELLNEAEKEIDLDLTEFLKFEKEMLEVMKQSEFMDILISHKL
jgi:hypothetical protein